MKYKWKRRPYKHQVAAVKEAIKGLAATGGFALLMAPRTGKTKTMTDIAAILHGMGRVNRWLIVCPISAIDVWIKEIEANCPYRYRIVVWDRHGRKNVDLPRWGQDILDIVIVNYDAFAITGVRRGKRSTGRYWVRDKFRAWQPQLMTLDESHRIKSPSAKKTQMICSVAWQERRPRGKPRFFEELVPYRTILTGTVLTKKKRIFDIYSQWLFLNPNSPLMMDDQGNRHTLGSFKEMHSVWTERNGYPQWLRNKPNTEELLRKLMHAEAFAITRDECYDLPPAYPPEIIKVPLDKSAPYYDEMAEEMIVELKSGEFSWAKIPLVQRLRLAQITNGVLRTEPKDPDDPNDKGRLIRVGDEKLGYLESILEDMKEQEEKVVIGARFRADISSICKLCQKMKIPVYEVHGGISSQRRRGRPSERDQMIQGFTKQEGCAVFIGQPAAASEAIDLRVAGTMIWYSLVPSWVQYTQFMDRIALHPRAVRYIYLLAEGTVDELQYESLQEDGDMARRITKSPDVLRRNFR
jgi:SNF2 family DNA or RNA helicase